MKPPRWYQDHEIELATDAAVSRLDTDRRHVLLAGGESLPYDRLVLCSGGRARRPAVAGGDLPGIHVLRIVADCDRIRSVAKPGTRAVVVGMGFIGCEVAASLAQLGVAVTAIVSRKTPLGAVLGEEVGAVLADIHRERGVELITGDRVVRFEGSARLERVTTDGGAHIDCDFAVVGAGIEAKISPVTGTSIACENGILVDGHGRTSVDGIYAAGDVANHLHPLFGRVRMEHYNNAERMGQAVARSMLGDQAAYGYVHSF